MIMDSEPVVDIEGDDEDENDGERFEEQVGDLFSVEECDSSEDEE